MKKKILRFGFLPVLILLTASIIFSSFDLSKAGKAVPANQDDVIARLQTALGDLSVNSLKEVEPDEPGTRQFEINIEQPIDHWDKDEGSFSQYVILTHRGFANSTVIITEGYSIQKNYIKELSEILDANEIRVEHRYFGNSKPEETSWHTLTLGQAVQDYHKIREMFAKMYTGKWVSTGWSKGGQTALAYRYRFPEDVDATVAYDSPLNFELEDRRIDSFFYAVGTEACRQKLIDFQRLALSKKEALLPMFIEQSSEIELEYGIGPLKAFEYIVLEYPFSFWQYEKIPCGSIPSKGASNEEILNHLEKVVSFYAYSNYALNSASMYQFCTELGYYGYITENVSDLLDDTLYTNRLFAPQGLDDYFNPWVMKDLNEWLCTNGNNIVYIYGSLDPWSACAVETCDTTNAVSMFLEGGNHFTFIETFSSPEKEIIFGALEKYLGDVKIHRKK